MNVPTSISLSAVERESFLTAQARHRATARGWAGLLALVVAAIAVVISVLLAPLACVLIGLLLDLLNLLVPTPDLLTRAGHLLDAITDSHQPLSWSELSVVAALASLPVLLAMAVVWHRLGRIFDAGHDAALGTALGLRGWRTDDLEEQQLRNLTDEMALAAGRTPPVVRLMDSAACNIAILGEGDRSTLIVTRGVVDQLARAPTQALVGQAIAALGNGDGLLASRMLRLRAVTGFLMVLAQAPLSRMARMTLRPLFRLGRRREDDDLALLQRVLGDPWIINSQPDMPPAPTWRNYVWLPLAGAVMVGILIVPVSTFFLLTPISAVLWRRRRLLADAMAVQYTRDPQALADACLSLAATPTGLGLRLPWLSDLFLLDSRPASTFGSMSAYPSIAQRVTRLNAMGAHAAVPATPGVPLWKWLIVPPLGTLLGLLAAAVTFLGIYVSTALNGMFLVLPTVLLHALLRQLGHD